MDLQMLEQAGMDTKDLLARLMQNEALISIFVKKFLQDENYPSLLCAMQVEDPTSALSASHTLKGMCGNLSLKKLFELFSEQVRRLRADDFVGAKAMMPEITQVYEETCAALDVWVKSL